MVSFRRTAAAGMCSSISLRCDAAVFPASTRVSEFGSRWSMAREARRRNASPLSERMGHGRFGATDQPKSSDSFDASLLSPNDTDRQDKGDAGWHSVLGVFP